MLFILVMDPLQTLLNKATEWGLLHPIGADSVKLRTSLYTDDATLFLRPLASDVSHLQQLLTSFGSATGLRTNVHKSQVFPINCLEAEVFPVLSQFNATIADFPCQYLGLPLSTGRIQREDEQILIDKVAAKLPGGRVDF
jgi:hypothetical protein